MKITEGDITVEYPEIGFAFNPISIKVTTTHNVSFKANGITVNKESKQGITYFDASSIARLLFDREQFHKVELQDTTLFKTLPFEVTSNGITLNGEIKVLWGALQIGETYRQTKKLKMFKGYPFTVPLFLTFGGMLQFQKDGGVLQDKENVNEGKLNIDISNIDANRSIRLLVDSGDNFSTFDVTFDFTFRGVGVNSVVIDIDVEEVCSTDGIYLRWINKHGEYNYYLFKKNLDSLVVSDIEVVFDSAYRTTDFTDGYHAGMGQSIGKGSAPSRKLYASLISDETFDFLTDLVESPVVDEFAGYDENNNPLWISVTIASGTTNKSKSYLQDFELTLVPNKKLIQSL